MRTGWTAAWVVAGGLVFAVAGCGGDDDSSDGESSTTTASASEVTEELQPQAERLEGAGYSLVVREADAFDEKAFNGGDGFTAAKGEFSMDVLVFKTPNDAGLYLLSIGSDVIGPDDLPSKKVGNVAYSAAPADSQRDVDEAVAIAEGQAK